MQFSGLALAWLYNAASTLKYIISSITKSFRTLNINNVLQKTLLQYTVCRIMNRQVELHGAWFLEGAQHQLVTAQLFLHKCSKKEGDIL